ncbi:MAG: ATP/GTP-binding protein [Actinomycetota bacterium]|nr:ATP/GTP-binding protein [Actinomycetota bacterium]
MSYVEAPPEWRATTVQACGLFPWAVGGGTPTLGVPVGRHLRAGTTVCFDVINWFERGRFLPNPSYFCLGLPGLGKSTFTRRQVLGLSASGVRPLVLGDLKPDYADLIAAIGGQVVRLGRGLGALNVLAVGALEQAARRLGGPDADRLRAEAHGRRLAVVSGLILIVRGTPIADYERAVLSAALRVLFTRHATSPHGTPIPVLPDLVRVLDDGPEQVRAVTLDRGDETRYRDAIDPLHRSLLALLDGPLGDTFSRQTTVPIDLDSPGVAIDVSGISSSDTHLQAAVLLACWSDGFGAVESANALADARIAPQRRYFVVLDELWRVLRSGVGMVDNVDALTRLNRTQGVGMAQITHTMSDLRALANPEDIAKARGFVERAGAVVVGGLPAQELDDLSHVVPFTRAERDLITSWSTPPSWDDRSGPPGMGNFLLKIGRRPGVPMHLDLTAAELAAGVHDTNKRWTTTPGTTTTGGGGGARRHDAERTGIAAAAERSADRQASQAPQQRAGG